MIDEKKLIDDLLNGDPERNVIDVIKEQPTQHTDRIRPCQNCRYRIMNELQDDCQKTLNPAGEYAVKFAENHGMTIDEAMEQPMVKARFEFFNKTGM